jgi:hypothetical protein
MSALRSRPVGYVLLVAAAAAFGYLLYNGFTVGLTGYGPEYAMPHSIRQADLAMDNALVAGNVAALTGIALFFRLASLKLRKALRVTYVVSMLICVYWVAQAYALSAPGVTPQ